MNNHSSPNHQLTPECAALATLLPLLDDDALASRDAERVREHLAGCSACQAQQRAYSRLNIALRRHFGLAAVAPLRTEEIMGDLPTADTSVELLTDADSEPVELTSLPLASQMPAPRHPRRVASFVASLAAVVLIALFATLFYVNRAGPGSGPGKQPGSHTYKQTSLTGISMVSPDEGWMIGNSATITYTTATQSTSSHVVLSISDAGKQTALLYHYRNGRWTPYTLSPAIAGSSMLRAISMDSLSDGWAVGIWYDGPGFLSSSVRGLLLHYDGTTWHQASSPINDEIAGISMVTATDGWAFTSGLGAQGPSLLHYDGASWQVQPLPAGVTPTNEVLLLTSLASLPDGEVWMTGNFDPCTGTQCSSSNSDSSNQSDPSTSVILHYGDGAWTVQTRVTNGQLSSVSMTGPDAGWAVGSIGPELSKPVPNQISLTSTTFALHYAGGRWVREAIDGLGLNTTGGIALGYISALSPTDVWAAGTALVPPGAGVHIQSALVFLHYDGSRWTASTGPAVPADTQLVLSGSSYGSTGNGWVIGYMVTLSDMPSSQSGGVPSAPLLLHYTNGAWSTYNLS